MATVRVDHQKSGIKHSEIVLMMLLLGMIGLFLSRSGVLAPAPTSVVVLPDTSNVPTVHKDAVMEGLCTVNEVVIPE